jgi:putative aldouronate transport system permease protein
MFITMVFSGGLVSSYVVNTNLLGLKDNFWVLVFPVGFNGFWVIVMRTFYKTMIPEALVESAAMDGAAEWRVWAQIVLPLSLPGVATVALFSTLGAWNEFFLNMLYMNRMELYNLQRLIQQMLNSITTMREMAYKVGAAGASFDLSKMPSETLRMAVCVVTIGPIVLAYPFFQKYFIKGLTIGAVKE